MSIKGKILLYVVLLFLIGSSDINAQDGFRCSCVENDCGDVLSAFKILGNEAVVCGGKEFEVDNLTTVGDIDFYIWSWGDGAIDTVLDARNVKHTYAISNNTECEESTLFDICLWIVRECSEGISCHTTQQSVKVLFQPEANFVDPPPVCPGEEFSLTNSSCNSETYFWEFEGGSTSMDENPTFSYENPGIYTIKLSTTNECGNSSITKTIEVLETPVTTIELNTNGGIGCEPDRQLITFFRDPALFGATGDWTWTITPDHSGGSWCVTDDTTFLEADKCVAFYSDPIDYLENSDTLDIYFMESGVYEIALNYSNKCIDTTIIDSVIIYKPIELGAFSDITGCDQYTLNYADIEESIIGDIKNYNWIFTNGSIASFSGENGDFGSVTFNESGSVTLQAEGYAPCDDDSISFDINVFTNPDPTVPELSPNAICSNGDKIALNPAVAGGDYYFNGLIAEFILLDTLVPALFPANTTSFTIEHRVGVGTSCPRDTTFTFTVIPSPEVSLGDNPEGCEMLPNFMPNIVSFGGDIDSWSWTILRSDGSEYLTSTSASPTFNIQDPDNYTIVAEVTSDECGSTTDTAMVFVAEDVPAVIDQTKTLYCLSDGVDTLSAMPDGGVWSGDGITDAALGIVDISLLSPGSHTITYSLTSACTSEDQFIIEVVTPESIITRDTFYCITDAPTELVISPTGGMFSGPGIIDENTGLFDPNISGAGSINLRYNYLDVNGCDINYAFDVTVDSIPELTALDTFFVCNIPEDQSLPDILGVQTSGEVGTFIYTGEGVVDAETGSFNSTGLAFGFYPIEIQFITRSCTNSIISQIEVGERPVLEISSDTTLCIIESTFRLESNLNGGNWSSADCIIDPVSGVIDLEASGGGMTRRTCVFEYVTDEGTSCEQRATVSITIVDPASDLVVPNPSSLCYFEGSYTIEGFGPTPGTWTGEGVIDEINGVIDIGLLTPGNTYTYTYCVLSEDVDCSACKETSLEILPLPIAQYDSNIAPCFNQEFTLDNQSIDALTYEWDFGDGAISNLTNPTHSYASAGEFDIRLIAFTDRGCTDTIVNKVYVTSPPVLDFTMITQEGCAPLELEYINNSSGENLNQYWIIEGVDTIREDNPIFVLDSVVTDSVVTIELVIFNECEVQRSAVDVLVHPYPIVSFGVNNEESCSPDTVLIRNVTQGEPEALLWDFGNGNTSTDFNPPYQIYTTPDDSISIYTVVLTASNMCGTRTDSQHIRVLPNMVDAFFQLDKLTGCPPLEIEVQNFATIGSTVTYDFGDGTTSSDPNTTHIYTVPGDYVITQYAISCGLDSIKSDTIKVHPLTNLAFDSPEFACLGDTTFFINNSTGGNAVEWNFGDGTMSNETSPSHIYSSSGSYTIQLVMNSEFFNCPDTLTKTIIVPPIAFARFTPDPLEVCPFEVINFSNQSTGATNYFWDFGDGVTSNEFEPSHAYTSGGSYVVNLKVFDEYGCQFDTTKINMLVHEKPISQFALDLNDICQFYDTLHTLNSSPVNTTNTWYLNDALLPDATRDIAFYSDTPGENKLELISTSPFNCKDTSAQSFNVLPSPIAQIDINDITGCQPLTVQSNDVSMNADYTLWIYDGVNTSNNAASVFEYLDHGNFDMTLVSSSINKCPDDTSSVNIIVHPRAVAAYTLEAFDSCGAPKTVQFTNTSQNSEDYFWDFGSGQTTIITSPQHSFSGAGVHSVNLLANNQFDCPGEVTQSLELYPQPVAAFELPIVEACLGDTIIVFNSTTNANNYSWLLNDQLLQEDPLVISEAGTYGLQLIARYDDLCVDTLAYDEVLRVFQAPLSNFEAISDESQSVLGDVRFVNLSENADAYDWDFGDGNSSTELSPVHEYDINGPIGVTLTAHNDNNGNFRCSNTSFIVIQYEFINTFFAPNAMSPEQNFGNDLVGIFKPVGMDIANYTLEIFSPWGDRVALLSEVLDGEPIDFWDGTYKGQLVPQGVYLWKASIEYRSGQKEFKNGNVTVIR